MLLYQKTTFTIIHALFGLLQYALHGVTVQDHSEVTDGAECISVTSLLQELHWLLVRIQLQFKLAMLMVMTPYLDICGIVLSPFTATSLIRSSKSSVVQVPSIQQCHFIGLRKHYSVSINFLWKSLPPDISLAGL